MRNVVIMPLDTEKELVIATDNHGAIGEKTQDAVHVPNIVVGYYACRVAMMELLAVNGKPFTIVMQNFTGDAAWETYKNGINQLFSELQLDNIAITGSTESNFPGLQSALGLTIIGTRKRASESAHLRSIDNASFAVIGTPLVGDEVKEQQEKIAPLSLFRKFCEMEEIISLLPVGSKGIQAAWQAWTIRSNRLSCSLDIDKSAGPASCFLIAFKEENKALIQQCAGEFYYELTLARKAQAPD